MPITEQLLFSIEESFEDNFTTFHNNIFLLGLGNDAIVLYLRLKSMAYGKKTFSYPSVQTLADYFGVNRRTIQRWLKELIDRGVITRIEWFNEKTKMQTSNRYLIRDISKLELSTEGDRNVAPQNTGGDKFVAPYNIAFEEASIDKPTDLGCDINVVPGVTQMSHKEIQAKELNWIESGEYEKVWPYVKAVGDMCIDPDDHLGRELIKITLTENGTPEQLRDAIRELDAYTAVTLNPVVDNPVGFIRSKIRSYVAGDQVYFSAWRRDHVHARK
jgi:predicted transcriptional regulator